MKVGVLLGFGGFSTLSSIQVGPGPPGQTAADAVDTIANDINAIRKTSTKTLNAILDTVYLLKSMQIWNEKASRHRAIVLAFSIETRADLRARCATDACFRLPCTPGRFNSLSAPT